VKYGLGKSEDIVSESDDIAVSKVSQRLNSPRLKITPLQALYAADILYIVTLWWSKGATILLTKRLTPSRQHRYICYALGGFVTVWAIVSVFLVALRDDISAPWLDRSTEQFSQLVRSLIDILS
jgi:hypothetical protein